MRSIDDRLAAAALSAGNIKVAFEDDPQNFILMHALGANVARQVASVLAAGILIQMVFLLLLPK
ncbi:MAG: sodium ion-translocating decarboxylase subunit beta [Desulfobacterales bacterium]|nr:MAG: sodium ion-translocating decarboxylase subunit beta [Desulfobacterales bacterium]